MENAPHLHAVIQRLFNQCGLGISSPSGGSEILGVELRPSKVVECGCIDHPRRRSRRLPLNRQPRHLTIQPTLPTCRWNALASVNHRRRSSHQLPPARRQRPLRQAIKPTLLSCQTRWRWKSWTLSSSGGPHALAADTLGGPEADLLTEQERMHIVTRQEAVARATPPSARLSSGASMAPQRCHEPPSSACMGSGWRSGGQTLQQWASAIRARTRTCTRARTTSRHCASGRRYTDAKASSCP